MFPFGGSRSGDDQREGGEEGKERYGSNPRELQRYPSSSSSYSSLSSMLLGSLGEPSASSHQSPAAASPSASLFPRIGSQQQEPHHHQQQQQQQQVRYSPGHHPYRYPNHQSSPARPRHHRQPMVWAPVGGSGGGGGGGSSFAAAAAKSMSPSVSMKGPPSSAPPPGLVRTKTPSSSSAFSSPPRPSSATTLASTASSAALPAPLSRINIAFLGVIPHLGPLLSLSELSTFCQTSKRLFFAVSHGDVIKSLAVRHPKEGPSPRPNATPLLRLLKRYEASLTKLRVGEGRVFNPVNFSMSQGFCKKVTHLILKKLNLSDVDLEAFSMVLAKNCLPCLESLDLSLSRFGDQGIIAFAQALAKGGSPRLSNLDLGANGFSIEGYGLQAMAEAMEMRSRLDGKNTALPCDGFKRLVLGAWNWMRTPALSGVQDLFSSPLCVDLKELYLDQVAFMTPELQGLAAALRSGTGCGRKLHTLHLRIAVEDIKGQGLATFVEAIRDGTTPNLKSFIIARGNAHDNNVISALIQGIENGSLGQLGELELSHAGLTSDETWRLLEALSANNGERAKLSSAGFIVARTPRLHTLALNGNPNIGPLGFQALSTTLRENGLPYLTCLNMNGTMGGDKGLRELSRVLKVEKLHLNHCDIGPEGIAWLGGAFARGECPALQELYLAKNEKIGPDGIKYLAAALREAGARCQLRVLDLRWTEMEIEGAEALSQAFCAGACPRLATLYMMQGPSQWTMEKRAAMIKIKEALTTSDRVPLMEMFANNATIKACHTLNWKPLMPKVICL